MSSVKAIGRRHPALVGVPLALFVAGIAMFWFFGRQAQVSSSTVFQGVPDAPKLSAAGSDQKVYRIDASRSSVTYTVEEQLAGTSHTATAVTKGIAGDILVDGANPAASTVGDVVVNVEQFTSDQALRDARIRHDFLESARYPLATYHTTSVTGLPARVEDATDYALTLHGDLTVKQKTNPVELAGTVRRENGELRIKASATVTLSAFEVGPINLIGLASTGDEAKLAFDLVAPDASTFTGSSFAPAPDVAAVQTTGGPSFTAAVKPILEQKCASCHNTGGAGAAIWKLDSAGDASKVASGLGLTVKSNYMPPWLASDAGIPLQHSLALSDDERKTLMAWADSGGPLDVDAAAAVKAPAETIREPQRDAVLALPEPYQGSPALPNDYRCFVLDPKVTQPTPVVGYQFLPDQKEVVHHALVYRLKGSARAGLDAADAADAGPGWSCFGGVSGRGGGGGGQSPTGETRDSELVMGWAPGQLPAIYPDGAALSLEPGDVFVIQMHYHYAHANPPDQSKLALDYGDKPVDQYDRVRVTTYLAPAEIPCDTGQTGPLCSRDAAIAELTKQYGPSASYIANGLHLLCGTTPDQIAKLEDGIAKSSCEHRVGREADIIAVLGHEHEIGKTFRMTLNPGTPEEKILLDIPRWDFNWQMNYAPVETIHLKRGDTIRVECSWDRKLVKPSSVARWITWSEGTEDEMCFSTIATRDTKR